MAKACRTVSQPSVLFARHLAAMVAATSATSNGKYCTTTNTKPRVSYGLKTQAITLRAYTSYMRNFDSKYFYRKRIQIIGQEQLSETSAITGMKELSIQAFPEGGALIDGMVLLGEVTSRSMDYLIS